MQKNSFHNSGSDCRGLGNTIMSLIMVLASSLERPPGYGSWMSKPGGIQHIPRVEEMELSIWRMEEV